MATEGHSTNWWQSPATRVILGGLLLWAAFPRWGLFPLAWIAPWPWLHLISVPQLAGRRPYGSIYFGSWVSWMMLLHWVRLPHWSAWFGWVALAAYLAIYLTLFIGLSRTLVHRGRWPLPLAAAVIWTGLEVVRGYLFTGLSLLSLGHTLYLQPWLIQVADFGGAYLVSGLIMLVSGLLFYGWQSRTARPLAWCLALLVVSLQCGYGWWGSRQRPTTTPSKPLDVLLIQGSIDTTFDPSQDPWEAREVYWNLTRDAVGDRPPDLIVWPESMFVSFIEVEQPVEVPDDLDLPDDVYRRDADRWQRESDQSVAAFAREFGADAILGGATWRFHPHGTERFNTALWVSPAGTISGRYHKMHPVMFGEYVPLGSMLPWLYQLTPMPHGLDAGERPVPFEVGGWILSPAICFENMVPHLIRRQVLELRQQDKAPDALVTITNDGWFWGSSLLDHHLACAVFRSVEHHLPMLISANTGFSAVIDARGRVLQRGPRRAEGAVRAQVSPPTGGSTGYQFWGDWPWLACVLACLYAFFLGRVRPQETA
ncbi:MAG: apolipoprotein N-acyltransferase [Planctomycetota bacterium]